MKNKDLPAMPIPLTDGQSFSHHTEADGLTKREYFAAHAPEMPEWWPRFYRYNIIDPEDTSILNGGESKFGDMNYKGYLSAIASWRWHYADMMLEGE